MSPDVVFKLFLSMSFVLLIVGLQFIFRGGIFSVSWGLNLCFKALVLVSFYCARYMGGISEPMGVFLLALSAFSTLLVFPGVVLALHCQGQQKRDWSPELKN